MKLLVALCVLALVVLASASPRERRHSRGCIYILGRCHRECEVGTHAYAVGCAQITPQPTCDEPNPQKEQGIICDYSACYCDPPTVRDKVSGQCVPLDQCPKKD